MQRPRQPDETGQALFQGLMDVGMPADESRRARADAKLIERATRRLGQSRVAGKTQIIVAAECENARTIDAQMGALWTLDQAAPARQSRLLELAQAVGELSASWHEPAAPAPARSSPRPRPRCPSAGD